MFEKGYMKLKDIEYPQYWNVDDVPVILELDGEEVVGKSGNDKPFAVGKATVDGYPITKAEYIKLGKELYGKNFIEP